MNEEEKKIYDLIVNCDDRITQLQLARKAFVGCHERFEGYENPKQSTLRKVRQLVHDLRHKHDMQILSDDNGYFIKKSDEDAKRYMEVLEKKAKASAKAHLATYHKMSRILGVRNRYFEQQGKLFE